MSLRELNEQNDREALAAFAGLVITVVTFPLVVLMKGLILYKTWGWFLTPIIGTEPPGLITCFGLCLMASYVVRGFGEMPKKSKSDDEEYGAVVKLSVTFIVGGFLLLIAYLTHLSALYWGM